LLASDSRTIKTARTAPQDSCFSCHCSMDRSTDRQCPHDLDPTTATTRTPRCQQRDAICATPRSLVAPRHTADMLLTKRRASPTNRRRMSLVRTASRADLLDQIIALVPPRQPVNNMAHVIGLGTTMSPKQPQLPPLPFVAIHIFTATSPPDRHTTIHAIHRWPANRHAHAPTHPSIMQATNTNHIRVERSNPVHAIPALA